MMRVFYLNGGSQPERCEADINYQGFDRLLQQGGGMVLIRLNGQILSVHTDQLWSAEEKDRPKEQST